MKSPGLQWKLIENHKAVYEKIFIITRPRIYKIYFSLNYVVLCTSPSRPRPQLYDLDGKHHSSIAEQSLAPFQHYPAFMTQIVDATPSESLVIIEPIHIVTHLTTFLWPKGTYGIDKETLIIVSGQYRSTPSHIIFPTQQCMHISFLSSTPHLQLWESCSHA